MSSRGFDLLCRLGMVVALSTSVARPLAAQQPSTAPLSKAQLEQLVAPIALHPDPLLSQMLMASTYPTEVVQAARWRRENASLSGQALQAAMQKQAWDPSVKALTAVPETLQMMSDKLDWTQRLGDAFLAQQEDLLAAVQSLRQRAEAAGNLKSTAQQTVSKVAAPPTGTTVADATPRISIEPANPEYVSVPVYDPRVVYGDWPYADYEPFYWYPSGFTGVGILSFATAVAVGSAIWGNVDWWRNRANINVNRYNQFNRTNIADGTWRHNPRHRGNVPYRDPRLAQRFGDANRAAAREAYRGKAEAGRRDLGKANAGQAGAASKAKAAAAGAAAAGAAGAAAKAKSAAAARAKQAGGGQAAAARAKQRGAGQSAAARAKQGGAKSAAARNARSASAPRQAASSRQASRPRASAQRPQARGYRPTGGGRGLRAGGGARVGMRGGGGFRGGGGRRGRR
jgi:uncharacterized protein DUF3300